MAKFLLFALGMAVGFTAMIAWLVWFFHKNTEL